MITKLNPVQLAHLECLSNHELHERLVSKASTGVVFLTCSELSQLSPFPYEQSKSVSVWQNLGGCLEDPEGFADSILANETSNIVVYGHYPCALLELALNWAPVGLNMSKQALEEAASRASELRTSIEKKFGNEKNAEVMRKASEEHVIFQLSKVAALLPGLEKKSGRAIKIHAWLSIDGEVKCLDPQQRQFISARGIASKIP